MDEDRKTESTKDDRHFTRGAVLDNIEALIIAVVLALTLRCFVVEAFAIPTGSMAPTLYGNHVNVVCPNCGTKYAVGEVSARALRDVHCPNCGERASVPDASRLYGGDRILVNKVLYRFEEPKRWDPFVFVNPHIEKDDRPPKTTFIKRLIGLPGETLEIVRGDIIIDGQVQRKTRAARRSLWMHVYDSHRPWGEARAWLTDEEGNWTRTDDVLSVDAGTVEKVTYADFAGLAGDRRIRDHYGYNTRLGRNMVTDVRVRLEVKSRGKGSLVLALPEDEHDLTLVLTGQGSETSSRVMLDEKVLKELDVELEDDRSTSVEFARADFLVTVKVAGKEVFRRDFWTGEVYDELVRLGRAGQLKGHSRGGVRIGVERLHAEFSRIRIDRDIYYGADVPSQIEGVRVLPNYLGEIVLKSDEFVAMGDNSPQSSDSRYWGPVKREKLIGKAMGVWWYPTRIRVIQ